jgi:hypothetical protein
MEKVEIVLSDGKTKVEIGNCEWFADEAIPSNIALKTCFDEKGNPKCPAWIDCYSKYTKRRNI